MIPRGALIYDQSFATDCSAADFAKAYPDIATRYPFGTQRNPGERWPDGSVVTPAQAASSRQLSFTSSVNVDRDFWAGAVGPKVVGGQCLLHGYSLPKAQQAAVGGRANVGAMLRFPVWITHGVFEARVLLEGTWPGYWDALASYTAEGGQNNEFDAFEAYSGSIYVPEAKLIDDRRGAPFSTLHPKGKPYISNNTQDRKARFILGTGQWLTVTGLISPSECVVEFNGVEVFRAPTPEGFDVPRYFVIVRETDPRQTLGEIKPAPMRVDYFKVWETAGAKAP